MPEAPAAASPPPELTAAANLSRIASLLGIMVAVLAVACLYLARAVLIPIVLAVLLSFLLAPLMHLLRRLYLGRVVSAIAAAVIGLGFLIVLGWVIGTQIASLAGNLPRYQVTVEHKAIALREDVLSHLNAISDLFGSPAPQTTPAQPGGARPHPAPAAKPAAKSAPAAPPAGTSPQLGKAFRLAQEVLLPIASPLGTAAIVFVISIFILLQREDLRDRLIRVFGSGDLHRTTIAMDDIGRRLSHYYLAQLAVNAGFGTTIGVGLFVIGVPSPMLWGVLAMLLRFVPYLGSPLAMLLPVALAIAVAPGWSMALWTVALFAAAELVTSQAVEPFTYGRSTGLSPFAVVVAAIFWTWAWGPIGLLLSTPLTVCLVVLGRYVKPLEFLDVLLGTRPPLSPIENFYQRLLAGDPDEVQDHAELLLRDRSLAQYYDEVAIKGLQFATADAARGVLSPEALARIRTAIGTLVHELDELPDSTAVAVTDDSEAAPGEPGADADAPTAPEAEPVVLCVAGRGPLDDGAVEMLAQLLRRAGLDAHVLPHAAASRARIGGIDPRDVAMAVLCYLDLSTRPAHLRFLLRRLRHRLPGRPIVVGLSSISAPAAEVERLLTTVGADRTASSLRGMVDACRDLAGKAPLRTLATISPDPASPTPAQAAE